MIRKVHVFVIAVLILAAFLRLFRLETFLEFLGDQGRDAIEMKQILVDHNFTLLGPGTSVGKMYLGPLYYYIMIPFLAMTYPEPTGPAYGIALMGILTVALIYIWGRKLVGETAALIAMSVYAVSPVVVQLSRFSWQPNLAPLVGIGMMWLTYLAVQQKKPWYWVGIAGCIAIVSQLHYVALLSALPSAIFLAYDIWRSRKQPKWLLQWTGIFVTSLAIFVFSIAPLVAFDLRHNHLILQGFQEFFTDQKRPAPLFSTLTRIAVDMHGRSMFMTAELYGLPKQFREFNTVFTAILLILAAYIVKNKHSTGQTLVFLWVVLSLIGLSMYQDTVYMHYIGFIFPASFLLLGSVLGYLTQKHTFVRIVIWVGILAVIVNFVRTFPFFGRKTGGYTEMRRVALDVAKTVPPNIRYNVALLNENREYRAMKYRYFFVTSPTPPSSQYDYTNLDELIVFVENGEDPIQAPMYEVQQFFREHPRVRLLTSTSYPGIVEVYTYGK